MNAPSNKLFLYEQCRLCLENAGTFHIFETNNLVQDIFVCTGVKVSSSDNFPQKICVKCSEIVKSWKELRVLATKNDVHLHTLFGNDENNVNDDSEYIIPGTSLKTHTKPDDDISLCSGASSKQKLSTLLNEDEEITQPLPVIRQTISLRKDLFPPSSLSQSPAERESQIEEDPNQRLLEIKVERENRGKRVKVDDTETEQEEYVCATCSKYFDTYKKFYLHQRLHNKRIYCPLDACGKKFATKGDLQKHIRTHTGEKPFLCKICDKGFTQRVSLRSHIISVHSLDVEDLKREKSGEE